ncbi:MAG TPA: DUF2059 domain-containing protein [Salinimicrobium sp.]|nr:DUF2059 domain-containing protein [Salinimicrobium sp.]
MKKVLLAFAFLFIGFSAFSQDANPELKAKVIQIIEFTSGSQMDAMLEPLTAQIPAQNQEAFKKEVKESLKDVYTQMADIYLEHYTEEDIDGILAFYNSSVGKKMLEVNPTIMQQSMQLGQIWGRMQLQPIMTKYQN